MVAHFDSAAPAVALPPAVVTNAVMVRVMAVLGACAVVAAATVSPAQAADGPVVCPFRLMTGLPCPGCGLTRAWVFVLHGDLRHALAANPFVLVTLPAAIALTVFVAAATLRRRPAPDLRPVLSSVPARLLLGGWLVFAVIRIAAVLTGHATV